MSQLQGSVAEQVLFRLCTEFLNGLHLTTLTSISKAVPDSKIFHPLRTAEKVRNAGLLGHIESQLAQVSHGDTNALCS